MSDIEHGIAAWNDTIEKMVRADDFEGLLSRLLIARNEPDFDNVLRAAIVAVYRKGSEAGVAAAGQYFLAVTAEGKQRWYLLLMH